MKIAILGFSREGKATLKFLSKTSEFKNADISILDLNSNLTLPDDVNVKLQVGKNYLKNLTQFDIIFRSPGVPYNLPEIQRAIKNGVKISSGTQLFFEQLPKLTLNKNKITIIGVTGTKGKGTVSTLIYKILKTANKKVYLAGNIGKPALEILSNCKLIRKNDIFVVLELSSFQLQKLKYSPDIAVILDIFPEHLDIHKNIKEYVSAKANAVKWQFKKSKVFYFTDNNYSKLIAKKSKGEKIAVSSSHSYKLENSHYALKILGSHNLKNAAMAEAVAKNLNIPDKIILKTIRNFRGLEHRLEFVRCIKINKFIPLNKQTLKTIPNKISQRESASINFYNDVTSTNPHATAAAIQSFPDNSKILIAGGRDKNLNYSILAKALRAVELVILFGENKNKIKCQISNAKCQIKLCKNLKSAVSLAYQKAKKLITTDGCLLNPVIILSPGSSSQDMFKDYKEKGEKFKEIVKNLKT